MNVKVNDIIIDGWEEGSPYWLNIQQGRETLIKMTHNDARLVAKAILHYCDLVDSRNPRKEVEE